MTPASPRSDFIVCNDVWHSFASTKGPERLDDDRRSGGGLALKDVSLTIPEGQFVALVGASGCGKTTLLNMLAGLISPSSGEIRLAGEAPRSPNLDVGYMFARDALLPWRSACKNVELGLEVRSWPKRKRRQRAMEMLELVGLADRQKSFRSQLSQGMRQRVALARTLAPDPKILLMDEPFAALDARTKLELQGELVRILETASRAGAAKTVVFVTHDIGEAVLLADRVIVMLPSPGRVAMDAMVDIPHPRAEVLGEIPYTDVFRDLSSEIFASLEGALTIETTARPATLAAANPAESP